MGLPRGAAPFAGGGDPAARDPEPPYPAPRRTPRAGGCRARPNQDGVQVYGRPAPPPDPPCGGSRPARSPVILGPGHTLRAGRRFWMRGLGLFDGALQMFVEEPREPDVRWLEFMRWLVE